MTYHHHMGITHTRKPRKILYVLSLVGLIVGGYITFNALSPSIPSQLSSDAAEVTKTLVQRQPSLSADRLYVPKIGVDVPIVVGATEKTLEGGAWHRVPQNGDPIKGGNFVLAAHRFNLGLTPTQTRAKSPFYHIEKLQPGDQIFVDYQGVRYAYDVTRRYSVAGDNTAIEQPGADTKLTMYSCDLRGPKAGREVIEARPVGTIAWTSAGPKLKTN